MLQQILLLNRAQHEWLQQTVLLLPSQEIDKKKIHRISNDKLPFFALFQYIRNVYVSFCVLFFHYDCTIFITLVGVYIARSLRITCHND